LKILNRLKIKCTSCIIPDPHFKNYSLNNLFTNLIFKFEQLKTEK
jgi:hypothetical protein